VFKRCNSQLLQAQLYDEVLAIIPKPNAVYLRKLETYSDDVYKNLLGGMVVLFAQGNYEQAADWMIRGGSAASFTLSKYFDAAQNLIDCARDESQEALTALARTDTFKYLPAPFARRARKRTVVKDKHAESELKKLTI
jgi:hypothetical protein